MQIDNIDKYKTEEKLGKTHFEISKRNADWTKREEKTINLLCDHDWYIS